MLDVLRDALPADSKIIYSIGADWAWPDALFSGWRALVLFNLPLPAIVRFGFCAAGSIGPPHFVTNSIKQCKPVPSFLLDISVGEITGVGGQPAVQKA